MIPLNRSTFWTTKDGRPDGGHATGYGFAIAWQRGPLSNGRNGAFLLDVLGACLDQLENFETSEFDCEENAQAREHIATAIMVLESRQARRQEQGILGEQIPDPH